MSGKNCYAADMIRYRLFFSGLCAMLALAVSAANAKDTIDDDLVYKATIGNAAQVQQLLKGGASPNAVNTEGWSALSLAANRIDGEALPIVKVLVEAGADVNGSANGYSAVINAARNSQVDVVAYLLDHGANPRSVDHNGNDLTWIARHVREPAMQTLVDAVFERERKREQELRSEENLKRLVKEYSYALCEAKYWAFYVASKQDPDMDKEKLTAHINQRLKDANEASRQLFHYFPHLDQPGFQKMTSLSQQTVQQDLEGLISNRNRKAHGVGTQEDMNSRCAKISGHWSASLQTAGEKSAR